MPKGILEILTTKTGRREDGSLKNKLFQHLTQEEGIQALKDQLKSVTILMNVSDDWKEFERLWNKKYGQQELPFDRLELIEPKMKEELSDFNQKLKQGLNWNPKDHE
jgi:hypothetical protein